MPTLVAYKHTTPKCTNCACTYNQEELLEWVRRQLTHCRDCGEYFASLLMGKAPYTLTPAYHRKRRQELRAIGD